MRSEFGGGLIDELPGEGGFSHVDKIGQIVQIVKDDVSKDYWTNCRQNGGMAAKKPLSEIERAFIERTRIARMHRFKAAKDMAKALGIKAERYAKYESRSPLPHEYVEQFCLISGVAIDWLFTGEERKRA